MSRLKEKRKNESGQVMVISVLTLGGLLLASAGIAGLLMTYQIRAANDSLNSAKAFFAADAGIETASYCFFKTSGCDSSTIQAYVSNNLHLSDSQVSVLVRANQTSDMLNIFSDGLAVGGRVIRTLQASFEQTAP